MIKNLILDVYASDELVDKIENSHAVKLIKELNFKYGLKVFKYYETRSNQTQFLMGYDSGMALCSVWVDHYTSTNTNEYNFVSPYYKKDRASAKADSNTIYSVKLSSLMSTLARNNVIMTEKGLIKEYADSWETGVAQLDSSFGDLRRHIPLSTNEFHQLLKGYLCKNFILSEETLNKCKETLDNFNKLSKIEEEKFGEIERFFGREVYCVGFNKDKTMIVGSVKREVIKTNNSSTKQWNVIKPFKPITSIDDTPYKDIIAPITMFKVFAEGKEKDSEFGMPTLRGYYKDLDMITVRPINSSQYKMFGFYWIMFPC